MEKTLICLNSIQDDHAFWKMSECNNNGDFFDDARIAISSIQEIMADIERSHEDCTGLLCDIHVIQHATERISEMISGKTGFNKMDFTIFHYAIECKIKNICNPIYWGVK